MRGYGLIALRTVEDEDWHGWRPRVEFLRLPLFGLLFACAAVGKDAGGQQPQQGGGNQKVVHEGPMFERFRSLSRSRCGQE